jgi:hypothetical protein
MSGRHTAPLVSWIDTRDPATLAFAILGYACLLAALLVVVNLLLSRLTREERKAERQRRQAAAVKRNRDA